MILHITQSFIPEVSNLDSGIVATAVVTLIMVLKKRTFRIRQSYFNDHKRKYNRLHVTFINSLDCQVSNQPQ